MTSFYKRSAALLASAAAFSMMATPAMARDWGWGGGWGGRYHHRDRGIDGGDILAGILIIGGIAAIASAASKSSKDSRKNDEYRYPDQTPQNDRSAGYGQDNRPEWQENAGSAMNTAINRCMDEIDRGQTGVDAVDSVNREGEGWRVQGRVNGGSNFTCAIDGEGRIRQVSIDGKAL